MNKRRGASLLSVMVFLLFAVMITAQVFFFAKSSVDSVAEQREIMMYRMNLDSLVEEAKEALKIKGDDDNGIVHNNNLSSGDLKLKFSEFYSADINFRDGWGEYEGTQVKLRNHKKWEANPKWADGNVKYNASIHDLDYVFNTTANFNRTEYVTYYGNTNAHKKIFAAMNPTDSDKVQDGFEDDGVTPKYKVTHRYYLIRAWVELPSNYYGRKLMYQVLVRRNNEEEENQDKEHELETLSFQEVWF
ncbi:MAG: hypothetical protein IJM47_07495 [Synergistaceae bacterium]|nr:hypothetical protein [Synergistaceae bacterium]